MGVDYSLARPSPADLRAQGYTFACRYLSYYTPKNLSRSEADSLIANGIDIVSNWEQNSDDARGGFSQGASDAQEAQRQAADDGAPADRPIYFSVDWDASPDEQNVINSYFDGVASVIGRNRTGAYGSYYVIKRLFDAGKITYGWQTLAWSGGQWDPRAQLRQTAVNILNGDADLDQSMATDFGQWGHHAPTPATASFQTSRRTAQNADGRLETFTLRRIDHAVWHIAQTAANGSWGGWSSLGPILDQDGRPYTGSSNPVVGTNADGRLQVFAIAGGRLYTTFQLAGGGWYQGWLDLGDGTLVGEPAVALNTNGSLEVFAVNRQGALKHLWQTSANGKFGSWASLGGTLSSDPGVGRNPDGRLEVFALGTKNELIHIWQTAPHAGWSGWGSLGGVGLDGFAGRPVPGANADGRLEVFVTGGDQRLYHIAQVSGGWSGWISAGAFKVKGNPAMSRNADGRMEVFAQSVDNMNLHIWQTAPNGGWSSAGLFDGAEIVSEPDAAPNADGRLQEVWPTSLGETFTIFELVGSGWSSPMLLGGESIPGGAVHAGACSQQELATARGQNGANYWTCQGSSRYICDSKGNKIVETCSNGCSKSGANHDDQCNASNQPVCTSAESAKQSGPAPAYASYWTCQGTNRYVCDGQNHKVTQVCPAGCIRAGNAADDRCAPGLVWPNELSSANSDPYLALNHDAITLMQPSVLTLNFVNDPTLSSQFNQRVSDVIRAAGEGSRYHGYSDSIARAFLDYQVAAPVDLSDGGNPPPGWNHKNSSMYPIKCAANAPYQFDYKQLFSAQYASYYGLGAPLCDLVKQGKVHEVWVYVDGDPDPYTCANGVTMKDFQMPEVLESKQKYDASFNRLSGQFDACAGNGCFAADDAQVLQACGRSLRILYINAARGSGCAIHSLGHGIEHAGSGTTIPYFTQNFVPFANFDLASRFGTPFSNWYSCGQNASCITFTSDNSLIWSVNNQAGSIPTYNQGCGSVHFPPNARGGYDDQNPSPVLSTCENYGLRNGGGGADAREEYTDAKSGRYDSIAPDCEGGWQVYWRQSFPGLQNPAFDRAGGPMKNWWPFLFY